MAAMTRDTESRRLRVGVVGAGHWARVAHVPGFLSCAEVDLVAICDVDRERAEGLARETGIPRAYGSAAELLEREWPDLVSIATPDDSHFADAGAAIAAGAHVLCEKPLAVSVAEAQLLRRSAREAQVKTKMGFTFRYAPAMMRFRELVTGGELGTPQLLLALQQNGQYLDPATPVHWKMDPARTGGGAIVEYGIHTLDLARWIMGEPTRVCATSRTLIPERPLPDGSGTARIEVDDSTAWLMEFAGGATGVCHAGWATIGRPPGIELRVYGTRGAAEVFLSDEAPGDEALLVGKRDGHVSLAEIPSRLSARLPTTGPWWYRFPTHLIRAFVAEIAQDAVVGPTFDDGVRAQELLEAVQISAREARWVSVRLAHETSWGSRTW